MGGVEHKTWTTADKTAWGPGPWQDEHDKEQWTDPATGLPCLIVRNTRMSGAFCGYVGVSDGHPWFGKEAVEQAVPEVDYGGFCEEGDEAQAICHVPGPGEPDRVWWLGFHCAHAWDVEPLMEARTAELIGWAPAELPGVSYKTAADVKVLVTVLAAQAAAAAAVPGLSRARG
jgi:hypothetical protein